MWTIIILKYSAGKFHISMFKKINLTFFNFLKSLQLFFTFVEIQIKLKKEYHDLSFISRNCGTILYFGNLWLGSAYLERNNISKTFAVGRSVILSKCKWSKNYFQFISWNVRNVIHVYYSKWSAVGGKTDNLFTLFDSNCIIMYI